MVEDRDWLRGELAMHGRSARWRWDFARELDKLQAEGRPVQGKTAGCAGRARHEAMSLRAMAGGRLATLR